MVRTDFHFSINDFDDLKRNIGPLAHQNGGQGEDDRFRKRKCLWRDATTDAPTSNNESTASSPATSSSMLCVDKGKGKEVALDSSWEEVAPYSRWVEDAPDSS